MPDEPTSLLRVLVVSEDPLVLEEAEFGFPTGVEITSAKDARDAIEMIKKQVPDVVVIDIQTGSAGGFSLAKEMHQQLGSKKEVPILMLLERSQDAWLANQAGAARHRVKPLETTDLVADVLELAAT